MYKCEELFTNNTHRNLAIQFHLECSYTCLTYYEYRRAKEHLKTARDLARIDVNMIGKKYNVMSRKIVLCRWLKEGKTAMGDWSKWKMKGNMWPSNIDGMHEWLKNCLSLSGALGKRTRFQENFLAQLILDVKRKDSSPVSNSESPSLISTPKELLPKVHKGSKMISMSFQWQVN